MILPGVKGSNLKPPDEKGESSAAKKTSRTATKSGVTGGNKTKTETEMMMMTPLDVALRNYFGTALDDPQIKAKLSELIPRDRAQETSEGVQEFIKIVSKFIGQKNPFKEKASSDERPGAGSRSLNRQHSVRSEEIRQVKKNSEKVKQTGANNPEESLKRFTEKPQNQTKTTSLDFSKSEVARQKRRPSGSAIRKEGTEERLRKSTGDDRRSTMTSGLPRPREVEEPHGKARPKKIGERKTVEPLENGPVIGQTQKKRTRPSEIPLRKTRLHATKPVSLLLQKPLKDVESITSIEGYQVKKTFSPIEECSISSDLHVSVSETKSREKREVAEEGSKAGSCRPVEPDDIKLERRSKSPNIPLSPDFSFHDLTDEKFGPGGRTKILDLEKVRSSSFTVLTSRNHTLSRLETLHRQNISAKENAFSEKSARILESKLSFNLLAGNKSKRNVTERSSIKGDKPSRVNSFARDGFQQPNNPFKEKNPTGKSENVSSDPSLDGLFEVRATDSKANPDSPKISAQRVDTPVEKETRPLSQPNSNSQKLDLYELQKAEKLYRWQLEASSMANFINRQAEVLELSLKTKESNVSLEEKETESLIEPEMDFPSTPPPTPEDNVPPKSDPVDAENSSVEKSSRTYVTSESANEKSVEEKPPVATKESKPGKPPAKSKIKSPNRERSISKGKDSAKNLVVRGTALKFSKEEPSAKTEPEKVKLQIKLDMNVQKDSLSYTDTIEFAMDHLKKSVPSYDWSAEQGRKRSPMRKTSPQSLNDVEKLREGPDIPLDNVPVEAEVRSNLAETLLWRNYRSSSSLKRRLKYKMSAVQIQKKSLRSDAGDRWLPSSVDSFNSSASFPETGGKSKSDTKTRRVLAKGHSANRERKDPFEETSAVRLRRRSSEPFSCKGFVWKHADPTTPRGNKTSVSSMASSLRHLNTDELDDFVFWEPVPQKMTSCWEMSLYHFKRPWSVLSCSVFDDNRQSTTPGLILDNLRTGGASSTRRSVLTENERAGPQKETAFDVEPSIAQKNIDIRNWLAALNFSSPPSTSSDIINEEHFPTQSSASPQKVNKVQPTSKRRKVVPGLKFSGEAFEGEMENLEGNKDSGKWKREEMGDLMELIRRKSGGFVTSEQFFSSGVSLSFQGTAICGLNESQETLPSLKDLVSSEPSSASIMFKNLNLPTPDTPKGEERAEEVPGGRNLEGSDIREIFLEAPRKSVESCSVNSDKLSKEDSAAIPAEVNVWKYLFFFTLFVVVIYLSTDFKN